MPKSLRRSGNADAGPSVATRRKPQQSRAKFSSEALQDAFVRVLLERGFERVTVREVAAVAGVGVGTFYEYVANKEALAALTIHMCVKEQAQAFQSCIEQHKGLARADIAAAVILNQIEVLMGEAEKWHALFLLERRVSSPAAYRKQYDQYVMLWRQALASASDPLPTERLDSAARMVHAIMYGWITQSLITQGVGLDRAVMTREVVFAVRAFLRDI